MPIFDETEPQMGLPTANEPKRTVMYIAMARPLTQPGTDRWVAMLKLVGTMTQLKPTTIIMGKAMNLSEPWQSPTAMTASPKAIVQIVTMPSVEKRLSILGMNMTPMTAPAPTAPMRKR